MAWQSHFQSYPDLDGQSDSVAEIVGRLHEELFERVSPEVMDVLEAGLSCQKKLRAHLLHLGFAASVMTLTSALGEDKP